MFKLYDVQCTCTYMHERDCTNVFVIVQQPLGHWQKKLESDDTLAPLLFFLPLTGAGASLITDRSTKNVYFIGEEKICA